MTGASLRLFFHLTKPLTFLSRRPSTLLRLPRCLSGTSRISPPIKFTQNLRNFSSGDNYYGLTEKFYFSGNGGANDDGGGVGGGGVAAVWPEWVRLLECLKGGGYFGGNVEDEFVGNVGLSMEFVNAACLCLAFTRDRPDILRLVSRNDIEVLINDVYPNLFKSADETERRMRSFLQVEGSNEATSVDLMKYILSFVSNPTTYPKRNIKDATESKVRSLLYEMANLASRGRASDQYEQMPRNLGPNITMKRGDWICPKCSFMNFARNTSCLECEELRPKRQLADGEWDCPECNFFNYRKNMVCMKCECKRPDQVSPTSPTYAPSTHTQDADKEDKTERWFKKIKELHGVTGPTSAISCDEIHQLPPVRKEDNRFADNQNKDRPFSSFQRQQTMDQGHSSSFVPFVPFPPDYFTKKTVIPTYDNNRVQETGNQQMQSTNNLNSRSSITTTDSSSNEFRRNEPKPEASHVGQQSQENVNVRGGWTGKSLEGSAVTETDPLDMSEEAKAERWFKRVAQIKDISELSQIPDEDFPSIMPMRKGVNRFVVSKRKTPLERRLTSPQYRKNLRIMSSDPMKKDGDE